MIDILTKIELYVLKLSGAGAECRLIYLYFLLLNCPRSAAAPDDQSGAEHRSKL